MVTLSANGIKPKIEDKSRKQDARIKAIENNPCSLCKALGLPICRGHGGGGSTGGDSSGSDSGDSYEIEDIPSLNLKPSLVEGMLLSSFLEASEVWHESPEEDLLYLFNNDLALLSLSLDLSQGLITFKENKLLNTDEQKDLAILYDAINNEFKQFKKELSAQNIKLNATLIRENNKLTITIPIIPNSKHYDAFIARLIDKNLIPTKKRELELERTTKKQEILPDQDIRAEAYKSPTPFDISRGPKPTTDYKE
ncbi:hypothetical protein ACQUW5_11610 [Legionella sp. CNM-1927-20]|uniref:hypothetical protein n=1 Tax=Legionella sp. CNM-1927-20 TaxID=3422221 RepID=UPI00403B0F14